MQLQVISEVPFIPVQHALRDVKLYLFGFAFSLGNLLLPMTVHTIPDGGAIFLPLFFFTLVAAYSEGFLAGILVAIASPLINYAVTGMPTLEMLPTVLFKSLLVAVLAASISKHQKKLSFVTIAMIILAMQAFGGIFEYFFSGNALRVMISLKLGIPGMFIMAIGGYAVLRLMAKMHGGNEAVK
jgi:hypothetical protein